MGASVHASALAMVGLALLCTYAEAARTVADVEGTVRGKPCKGYSNIVAGLLSGKKGTCARPEIKDGVGRTFQLMYRCHKSAEDLSYAAYGEKGTCFIGHQAVCQQAEEGSEDSGGCIPGTVCRAFEYKQNVMQHRLSVAKVRKTSYCVRPDDKSDNALDFVTMAYHVKQA